MMTCWSGRRDLNPRLQPWQGCTLPLSYSRVLRTDVFYKRSRTLSSQKTACGKFSEDFHVRGKGIPSGKMLCASFALCRARSCVCGTGLRAARCVRRSACRRGGPSGERRGSRCGTDPKQGSAGKARQKPSWNAVGRGMRGVRRGGHCYVVRISGCRRAGTTRPVGRSDLSNGGVLFIRRRAFALTRRGLFRLFIPEIACAPGFLLQMTFFH